MEQLTTPDSLPPEVCVSNPVTRKINYLNNKDLLANVIASKARGVMGNELATMLQMLTSRYAKKGNFANYSYNEDMQAYAMLMLCKTWASFDENKSNNPFAFFTQCIKNSFIQYLNQERRVRDIKNITLMEHGFNPSFSYILEHEEDFHDRREQMLNSDTDLGRVDTTKPKIDLDVVDEFPSDVTPEAVPTIA